MRNKAKLVMIEQIVMILVFALAATICVRMFVLSEKLSKTYGDTDRAVLAAQNAAELLKSDGIAGYISETNVIQTAQDEWVTFFDSKWSVTDEEDKRKFSLKVNYTEDEDACLWRADIVVCSAEDVELFCIPVAGQK